MPRTAISKGLRILELLGSDSQGASVLDVTNRLDIPGGTAQRILEALAKKQLVHRNPETDRYTMTMKVTRLGIRYLSQSGVSAVYQSTLDRLAESSGELVRLALAETDRMTWVGMAQGKRRGLVIAPDTGREVSLHATAAGKAWLATLPLERALKLVLNHGFGEPTQFGPNAIRSVERLIAELKVTTGNGYALSVEEYIPGMSAIAVAVPSPGSESGALGTLSIAAPSARMTRGQVREHYDQLKEASVELSAVWPIIAARTAG